jgi:hypothetical protein
MMMKRTHLNWALAVATALGFGLTSPTLYAQEVDPPGQETSQPADEANEDSTELNEQADSSPPPFAQANPPEEPPVGGVTDPARGTVEEATAPPRETRADQPVPGREGTDGLPRGITAEVERGVQEATAGTEAEVDRAIELLAASAARLRALNGAA